MRLSFPIVGLRSLNQPTRSAIALQKQPAFFELLKVIFCKIHDERNFPNLLEFYATAREKKSRPSFAVSIIL
jgi:hypothetical protein